MGHLQYQQLQKALQRALSQNLLFFVFEAHTKKKLIFKFHELKAKEKYI